VIKARRNLGLKPQINLFIVSEWCSLTSLQRVKFLNMAM